MAAAETAKLRQMGVKSGVSDLCLPYPKGAYCGLYIEMKYGTNSQQPAQREFLADMAAAGHYVATCYSAAEAVAVIGMYLQLEPASITGCELGILNNSIFKGGKIKEGKTP